MKTTLTIQNSKQTAVIDGLESEADFGKWLDARFHLAATGNVRSQTYVSGNDEITRAAVIVGLLTHSGARFGDQREEAKKLYAKVARLGVSHDSEKGFWERLLPLFPEATSPGILPGQSRLVSETRLGGARQGPVRTWLRTAFQS